MRFGVLGTVFTGVLPAGVAALAIGVITPFGPAALASGLVMAPLWLLFTIAGWRMAHQRRFVDHRKWMIRSFALTMSIVTTVSGCGWSATTRPRGPRRGWAG